MSLVSVPFDSGMNEGVDQALLPQGVFREVRNMRLSRDGKLIPRPQLTAVDMNGAAPIVATDLWRYKDQLLATGYRSTSGANQNAWVYVPRGGTTADWRRIDESQASDTAVLPQVTNIRDLPRPLPANGGASVCSVAAGGGYVCTVWHETGTSFGYALVQRASDGAQILYEQFDTAANDPYNLPKVVYLNTSFVIAAVDTDSDLRAHVFRPDTDSNLSSTTLRSATNLTAFDICAVRGSSSGGYVVAVATSTPVLEIVGGTVNSAGTVSPGGLFSITTVDNVNTYSYVTVCADNTGGVFLAAQNSASNRVSAWTYTIGGVLSVGPTVDIFDQAADSLVSGDQLMSSIVTVNSTTCAVVASTRYQDALGSDLSRFECRSLAAHAATDRVDVRGSMLTSGITAVTYGSVSHVFVVANLESFKQVATAAATGVRDALMSGNALLSVQLSAAAADNTMVAAYLDQGLGGRPLNAVATDAGTLFVPFCGMAIDASTSKHYAVRMIADPRAIALGTFTTNETGAQPVVCEFTALGTERRQTAELDGQLFVAGGLPLLFAGAGPFVEPGFEVPHVRSATRSNGAGTLTNNGVYIYVALFRWRDAQGRTHVSQPSLPVTATLGAADDTVTLLISVPHSRRYRPAIGSTIEIELYRTLNGGATLRLVESYTVDTTADLEGENITIVDTSPDTAIVSNPILYTQSQTPVAHAPAPPCKYAVAGRSRVVLGGLPDETAVVFSKLTFPGEPIEFAPEGLLGYRKTIGEPVTALMALDEQVIAASAKSLYRIGGAGPDHSGLGEFLDPERIPGLGGVSDWRSVVEVPTGYFFQSSDEKLYFVDRGGSVSWVQGQAVRDTLATYPTITAATYAREQNCVFFACRNSAGSDGVLLVFDLRREIWYVDSESILAGTVTAAVDYNKRLTLASSGDVYQESPGTYLAAGGRVITGNIRNGSLASWNHLRRIGLRGSGLGTGTPSVTVSIDYEDGAGFVSLGAHSPSTSGNFIKLWRVGQQKVDSFKLRIDAADVALNELVLDIEPRRGVSRRNPSDLK